MIVPSPNDETIGNPREYEGPVKALLRLTETAGFLHSTDGCFYAQVSKGGRPEILALKSAAFRAWLIDGYLRAYREVPSDWAIRRVLGALEATARSEGRTASIFKGSCLTPVAKSAFNARQGTAPHCPPTPPAWHIHCFREKTPKTYDHPHEDGTAQKPAVSPK